MKVKFSRYLCVFSLSTLLCQVVLAKTQAKTILKTQEDKISYIIGQQIGTTLLKQKIKLNPNVLMESIKSALNKEPNKLSQKETMEVMKAYYALNKKNMEKEALANKEKGDKFLTFNKKDKKFITTKSGLQYKIIRSGKGANPTKLSKVKVHYRGTLIDGTEFDSSYKRKQPATFPVTGVIPGWTEALQLMKPGAKWELVIPSQLAYGPRGSGASVPPNSVLKFTVELLEIVKEDVKGKF